MVRRSTDTPDRRVRVLRRCAVVGALCALVFSALSGLSLAGTARAAEPGGVCENEAIREQQGSQGLPECRAYELVSPPGSTPTTSEERRPVAAENGERFAYLSLYPFPGEGSESMFLLSERGASGWATQGVIPPQGGLRNDLFACDASIYYSGELTADILADGFSSNEGEVCEGDVPELVAGEPRGVANLFLHSFESSPYILLDPFPVGGVSPKDASLVDATPDLSHIVFVEPAPLTQEAPGGEVLDLYEWSAGTLRLVSFLPNGTPSEGDLADVEYEGPTFVQSTASYTHALSGNGERVVFTAAGALYVRVNAMQEQSKIAGGVCSEPAKACTVEVDAAAEGAAGPSGGGTFLDASEDGSRIFFTDSNHLTNNATAVEGKPDLYEYNVETGQLSDLTVDGSEPAHVVGYAGASEDGSYLYFVADGVLTGTQTNSQGAAAVAGKENLYVRHAGATTFIATTEQSQWSVSPDGQFVVFGSSMPLTGYDNEPSEPGDGCGKACSEVFRYDASTAELTCVSCGPAMTRPTGPAGKLAGPTEALYYSGPEVLHRHVTNSGTVFFDSSDELAPQATDGVQNVYEYHGGEVSLISSGTSTEESEFLEMSVSGNDVFFLTDQALVQGDTDGSDSVYDARVNGGWPASPGKSGEASECEDAEDCRSPLGEPPVPAFGSSEVFSGAGDLVPAEASLKRSAGGKGAKSKLSHAQKLKRALEACARRHSGKKREACRRSARLRYGPRALRRGKQGALRRHGKGGKR